MPGASAADVLTRLGDKWKGLIEKTADLERTGKEEPLRDRPRSGLVPGGEQNYREAQELLDRLLRTCKSTTVAQRQRTPRQEGGARTPGTNGDGRDVS